MEAYSNYIYASDHGDQKSIYGYCTLVGENLVTWRCQKQHVVSLFNAKAKYHAMMNASFEMLWVHSFLQKLGFLVQGVMPMHCDSQAVIFLANNPNFHERTKHIKIDCHAIRHRVLCGFITTPYIGSSHQLVDILIKGLSTASYDSISRKLGVFDIYTPA